MFFWIWRFKNVYYALFLTKLFWNMLNLLLRMLSTDTVNLTYQWLGFSTCRHIYKLLGNKNVHEGGEVPSPPPLNLSKAVLKFKKQPKFLENVGKIRKIIKCKYSGLNYVFGKPPRCKCLVLVEIWTQDYINSILRYLRKGK